MQNKNLLATLIVTLTPSLLLAEPSSLQVVGQQGSYIADNTTLSFSSPTAQFTGKPAYDDYKKGVQINIQSNNEFYSLSFAAPGEKILDRRKKYTGATRFPFQAATEPGLDISGAGRGCNEVSGSFSVRDLKFSSDKKDLISFAVDFTQKCEKTMPEIIGSLRFNSKVASSLCPAANIVDESEQFILNKNSVRQRTNKFRNVGTVLSTRRNGKFKIGKISFVTKLIKATPNEAQKFEISAKSGEATDTAFALDAQRAFFVTRGTKAGAYYINSDKILYKLNTLTQGNDLTVQFVEVGKESLAFCNGKL